MHEGERVDRPLAAFLHLRLIRAEDPVAGLVHLQDGNTGGADIGGQGGQRGGEGGGGRQAGVAEHSDVGHFRRLQF